MDRRRLAIYSHVKDLCTKEVVGYAIGDRITRDLVMKAMKTAIKRERPNAGLIFHSDRDVQYCSNDFKDLLKANHIRQSMSSVFVGMATLARAVRWQCRLRYRKDKGRVAASCGGQLIM